MSRIQDILSKAERDGNTRRTRGLSDEGLTSPPAGGGNRPAHSSQAYEPAASHSWTPVATATAVEAERTVTTSLLDKHLVAALAPHSLAAEQYRSLRTRIKGAENGRA